MTCELPDVDVVIHLAGLSGVRDSLDRPTDYWVNNVIASQRLFDRYKDKRILYASSSTAYEPWKNPYAMSKYSMEQIAPPNSVGMRFTTVYGPGARETMLIPRILRNDVPYINVNHKRDFIHVDDLCNAIVMLIDKNEYGVIDIGLPKGVILCIFISSTPPLQSAKPLVLGEHRSWCFLYPHGLANPSLVVSVLLFVLALMHRYVGIGG